MKKNAIKLVVFDMAGTTINENNVVYKTIHETLLKEGYSIDLAFVLKHCAGKEKFTAIDHVLDLIDPTNKTFTLVSQIFEQFKKKLVEAYENIHVSTFDNVESTFKALKERNIKIALNTGYDKPTATHLLHKLNWAEGNEFDTLVTADDVKNGRPFPDMIQLAMQKNGIENPIHVAKVGDSIIDIEEGKNAKCQYSIGITTGAQFRETLEEAHPHQIIDNLEELLHII